MVFENFSLCYKGVYEGAESIVVCGVTSAGAWECACACAIAGAV